MADYNTKIKHGHGQFELEAFSTDKELTKDGSPVMSKVIQLQDEETNNQRHVISKDDTIKSDLSYTLSGQYLSLIEENKFDSSKLISVTKGSGNTSDEVKAQNQRVVDVFADRSNLTTTDTINDIQSNLGAIAEYADEPLLPLVKACAPLSNIVQNLSFYVELALNETTEQPSDGLTIDESAAVRLYSIEWQGKQKSLYSMLNYTLKSDPRENLRPYFKYLKLLLTALAKLPCVPPLTIWRGVTKDLSAEFPPGTSVIWWGFSSCTTSLTVLENSMYLGNTGKRTLFSVEAINGRSVRAHSYFVTEDEILLLPGTQMVVQSQLSPASDLHIIHLKQVIPDQALLQPPFEGISSFSRHLF